MLRDISDWFWNEKIWLNDGATWTEFENPPPNVYYPLERHILIPGILIGIILLAVRFIYERFVVLPFAKYMGLRPKRLNVIQHIPCLEILYAKNKFPEHHQIEDVIKKTNMSEREIQRWFRHKRNNEAPGRMKKFQECSWHLLFYTSSSIVGFVVLWDKPFFWDTKYCWIDNPRHHVSNDMFWYYLVEIGFYWNLIFSVSTDNKRKDFWEMFVHHIITIMLIYFSFACNQLRIGTIVLLVHDVVDCWMAAAKMANYVKKQMLATYFLVIFAIVWVLTRLYLYPFRVVWSASFESMKYLRKIATSHYFLNGLLWALQLLHLIWTFMIFRILFKRATEGKVTDVRSDTESSRSGED